jgi:hypothetical protein
VRTSGPIGGELQCPLRCVERGLNAIPHRHHHAPLSTLRLSAVHPVPLYKHTQPNTTALQAASSVVCASHNHLDQSLQVPSELQRARRALYTTVLAAVTRIATRGMRTATLNPPPQVDCVVSSWGERGSCYLARSQQICPSSCMRRRAHPRLYYP